MEIKPRQESKIRKDSIVKALKLVCLFNRGQRFTANQIAYELGITRQAAERWIVAASLFMPIAEEIMEPQGVGRPPTQYFII